MPQIKKKENTISSQPFLQRTRRGLSLDNRITEMAYRLALLGATSAEMAEFFGVTHQVWECWLRDHNELRRSVSKGKEMADMKVVKALYRRAKGYEVEEVTELSGVDEQGRPYSYTRTTKRHVPAEITAIKYWMSARQAGRWTDSQRIDVRANMQFDIKKTLEMKGLTNAQRSMIREIAIQQISEESGVTSN